MAMQFQRAERPMNPDLARATLEQAAAANQLRAQEKQGNLSAGTTLATMAPEGAWADLGASMGMPGVEATGAAGTKAAAEAGIAEGLAAEAAGLDALAAGATGAEAAGATAAIEGATAGTAASGAAPGFMSALGAMGPVGWAALAAIGLGLAG